MINQVNYDSNIAYLFSHYIREYDIQKANISILYDLNIITKDVYDYLFNSERMHRQVYIGNLIKNNSRIGNALKEGILNAKAKFFEANNILDRDILFIKNDAVFLVDKIAKVTDFGNVHFICKNSYNTFMRLNKLQVFYGSTLDQEQIDVKGIKEETIEKYHMPFLAIILEFIRTMNIYGPEAALDMISSTIDAYIRKEFPIKYYRCFRSTSDFSMPTGICGYGAIVEPKDYNFDINYNLMIMRTMMGYAIECLYEKINRG